MKLSHKWQWANGRWSLHNGKGVPSRQEDKILKIWIIEKNMKVENVV